MARKQFLLSQDAFFRLLVSTCLVICAHKIVCAGRNVRSMPSFSCRLCHALFSFAAPLHRKRGTMRWGRGSALLLAASRRQPLARRLSQCWLAESHAFNAYFERKGKIITEYLIEGKVRSQAGNVEKVLVLTLQF